ncbi:MAG: hypothetical protein D3922_07175 [Candidatus Electrothrix sp. AR1]|nr:hypothetical protein [Candidatus Electrothrix sp. AR1]
MPACENSLQKEQLALISSHQAQNNRITRRLTELSGNNSDDLLHMQRKGNDMRATLNIDDCLFLDVLNITKAKSKTR